MQYKRFLLAISGIIVVLVLALINLKNAPINKEQMCTKVYECLEVGSDVNVLKAHIQKEYTIIDHFVLLEPLDALETNKVSLYQKHKKEFEPYQDKITHIVASGLENTSDQVKAFYLKNQYLKALGPCHDKDIILFSSSDVLVQKEDLQNGVLWLDKHPQQVLNLSMSYLGSKRSQNDLKAATYQHVRKVLPAGIETSKKNKVKKSRLKAAFFPTLQP